MKLGLSNTHVTVKHSMTYMKHNTVNPLNSMFCNVILKYVVIINSLTKGEMGKSRENNSIVSIVNLLPIIIT